MLDQQHDGGPVPQRKFHLKLFRLLVTNAQGDKYAIPPY